MNSSFTDFITVSKRTTLGISRSRFCTWLWKLLQKLASDWTKCSSSALWGLNFLGNSSKGPPCSPCSIDLWSRLAGLIVIQFFCVWCVGFFHAWSCALQWFYRLSSSGLVEDAKTSGVTSYKSCVFLFMVLNVLGCKPTSLLLGVMISWLGAYTVLV